MRIISDKSNNTVEVIVERNADGFNYGVWNELLCNEEFSDFDFNISIDQNEIKIRFSLRNGELISNCAEAMSAEKALGCLSDFASFVFSGENNKDFILGANNIFCDGEGLRFIKAIAPIEQSKAATVKFFINSVIANNPNITPDDAKALIGACENEEQLPQALLDEIERQTAPEPQANENEAEADSVSAFSDPTTESISEMAKKLENEDDSAELTAQDEQPSTQRIKFCPSCGAEYDEDYVFCVKCGEMLQVKEVQRVAEGIPDNKEEESQTATPTPIAGEPVVPPAENETSSGMFGETTLLGFTNFGETSILGGGMNTSYDMPNLVRAATDEKIYITKRNFIIGKSKEKADYAVLNNSAISRVHAEIIVSGNEYYIFDKGSTNHTYVNNVMVNQDSSVQIFDGDEIKLADEVFTFRLQ